MFESMPKLSATLLTVLVIVLVAYLLYALTYRAYRIGKKGRNAVIKKRLRDRRRLDGGDSGEDGMKAGPEQAQIIDIADHAETGTETAAGEVPENSEEGENGHED